MDVITFDRRSRQKGVITAMLDEPLYLRLPKMLQAMVPYQRTAAKELRQRPGPPTAGMSAMGYTNEFALTE
ncbi:hypothetical protein FCOIX_784 [Fusarium coicis]|nr:hypothetical protein FCOIX_784 [Fusarium coicis]